MPMNALGSFVAGSCTIRGRKWAADHDAEYDWGSPRGRESVFCSTYCGDFDGE
jgi:hypothetical protein